jgi:hypothetical protein
MKAEACYALAECPPCRKSTVNIEFRCQLSKSYCLGWNVCRRLNFYRREGIFLCREYVTAGSSAWKMESLFAAKHFLPFKLKLQMCFTLCG